MTKKCNKQNDTILTFVFIILAIIAVILVWYFVRASISTETFKVTSEHEMYKPDVSQPIYLGEEEFIIDYPFAGLERVDISNILRNKNLEHTICMGDLEEWFPPTYYSDFFCYDPIDVTDYYYNNEWLNPSGVLRFFEMNPDRKDVYYLILNNIQIKSNDFRIDDNRFIQNLRSDKRVAHIIINTTKYQFHNQPVPYSTIVEFKGINIGKDVIPSEDLTREWLDENAECLEYCEVKWWDKKTYCPADEEAIKNGNYKCSIWKLDDYTIGVVK